MICWKPRKNMTTDLLNTFAALQHQHQQVALRLGEFSHLLHSKEQRAAIVESLMGVIDEISMHFGYEESLMESGDYEDFEHHRRQHMGIMTELGLMVDRLESNLGLLELVRGADFLLHWYQQHIAGSDAVLEAWLRLRS